MVQLIKATADDLEELHTLQVEAFMPLYEKYHDDEMSPAKESIERIAEKLSRPHSFFYFITSEGEKVGVIRIVRDYESADDSIMHISPLFIRPRFQGMGFGGAAIEAAFDLQSYADSIKDTTQYTEARVWSEVIMRELKSSREHLSFFLKFVEEYAGSIGDEVRPFTVETWENAFREWIRSQDPNL